MVVIKVRRLAATEIFLVPLTITYVVNDVLLGGSGTSTRPSVQRPSHCSWIVH